MKRIYAVFFLALVASSSIMAQELPYQDRGRSALERAEDLVGRLTLEEKTSLMMFESRPVERLAVKSYNWWNEALHGVARNGAATTYPQPIGMAASFDAPLLYEVFKAVSDEAHVKYRIARDGGENLQYQGLTFWTPNINIFRDPRWGRGMETYGEDPYLTGQLGMEVVRGLQGMGNASVEADPGDPSSPVLKAHACAKHFAVHSGPESTRHKDDVDVSERDLRETYLPAFKDLVTKAGVQEVMTAYQRFRGYPCGASDYLVNTILRGEWGYKGLITSDCWAVDDFFMPGRHGFSRDGASAAAAAVRNGVDTECGEAYRFIPEAVSRGLLDEADVDRNLVRLMTARFQLGEMDGETPWDNLPDGIVEGAAHRALARRMASESLVLLRNEDGVLPLRPTDRIALIGPNYDDRQMQWGNYEPRPEGTITLRNAMEVRVPGLTHFRACGLVDSRFAPEDGGDPAIFAPALGEEELLSRLEGIDIVVFAGGISPKLEGEEMPVRIQGFSGGDRTDLELPEVQRNMLKLLHRSGKKVVLVNFSGSAMSLVPETESCDAILQVWYPGQEGGAAIADVLFGDVCPSGKLPVTFYKSIDDLPDFRNYDMAGRTYRFFTGETLFPFGYGLSYTDFRYGKGEIEADSIMIPVTNAGSRSATEVVQLYVRRPSDTEGPQKTLRGFRRVFIPAGETVKVYLPLTDETFTWWSSEAGDMVPLRGAFELLYGPDSEHLESLSIER
mgnify:CR=1 FL=1